VGERVLRQSGESRAAEAANAFQTNEPDPDTNNNFGIVRESRKIVAWGGTVPEDEENPYAGPPKRLWFYDLSAGPENWGGSYDITNADIDGDGAADYRIRNIWGIRDRRLRPITPGSALDR
jgi:hypothetical protein